ncbi:MAG: carbohydrate porin, partial [Rhodopirellula sp. JB053]
MAIKIGAWIGLFAALGWHTANGQELDFSCAPETACDAMLFEEHASEEPYLLGNCCGTRSLLQMSGVTPFLYYDSIFAANVDGGLTADEAYTGQIYAGADLDLEQLWGWDGTTLKISMVERHGDSV